MVELPEAPIHRPAQTRRARAGLAGAAFRRLVGAATALVCALAWAGAPALVAAGALWFEDGRPAVQAG